MGMSRANYLRMLAFFLAPAVIIYSVFSVYPLLATIVNSFYLRQPDGSVIFNGLGNFDTLLTDTTWSVSFWNAMKNNVVFFLIHMLVQNPIGIALTAATHVSQVAATMRKNIMNLKATELTEFLEDEEIAFQLIFDHLRRASDLVRGFKDIASDRSLDRSRWRTQSQ